MRRLAPNVHNSPSLHGLPDWIDHELIRDTQQVWSPYYPNGVSEEDAIEILRSVGELFDTLGNGAEDEPNQQ